MPSKRNDFMQSVLRSVATALLLGLIGAATKTYMDVQELKARFEYINGSGWKLPAGAK